MNRTACFAPLFIALSIVVPGISQAATFDVNSVVDAADANIGDGVCDAGGGLGCTLRAAINEANDDTTADIINVPPGRYILSVDRFGTGGANDGDGESGDLDIDRDVTIVGSGPGNTIISGSGLDMAFVDRIFHFRGSTTDVNLSGVTIEGGRYDGSGGAAIHNAAGGIINISDVVIRDISASGSGPITNQGSGAASAVNLMSIRNSAIVTTYGSNTSAILQDYTGTRNRNLELENVTIASTSNGSFINNRNGSLRFDKGTASLNHVTLFNNRYGIDVESATVTVQNSLFVNNGDDVTGRNCRTDIQPVDANGDPSGAVIPGGTITSLGGNYSSDATCTFFSLPSDVNGGGDPGLVDMIMDADTIVVPFFTGSEITSAAGCAASDQTGAARGAACVIGAYESTIAPKTIAPAPTAAAGTVSGVVFRDYNDNGQRDVGEPPISGITVSAYVNATGAIDTAVTDANGHYVLNTAAATDLRIEFTTIPAYLVDTAVGPDSGTTIQFVKGAASEVNLGLYNPADYCQPNPDLATSCFLFGDQGSHVAADTLVGFPFDAGGGSRSNGSVIGENGFGGSGNPTGPWVYDNPGPDHLATGSQIGSTWGIAWRRKTGDLFAAAFTKRHSGHGPSGPGAIYRVDPTGATAPTVFLTLPDVNDDPHATNAGDWAIDADAFDDIGRTSFGDMDISDDDSTLFVANLQSRTLDVIDIDSVTRTAQVPFPFALPGAAVGCAPADVMPFAVSHNDGVTYTGLVCSATSTQNASQLRAYVYAFSGGAFGGAPVLEFPLGYPRGESYGGSEYSLNADWKPWTPQAASIAAQIPAGYFDQEVRSGADDFIRASYPQPMLADIEFDNGDMVIAIMDRTGHQQANAQRRPDGGSFPDADPAGAIELVDVVEAAGDLLRACATGTGTWTLENNASCGSTTTAGANNQEGAGGGEYYFEDAFLTAHPEVLVGGLEQVPGQSNVAYVAYDPVLWNRDFNSGGVHWASNEFGTWQRGYRLYDTRAGQDTFAKANGLGDLEAMCRAAPIEIGNFVWIDSDNDGLQDPDEAPVAGVLVGLYDDTGTLIAIVETNADGQYLFSSDPDRPDLNTSGSGTPEFDYGIAGLTPDADYTVAILDSNFDPGGPLFGWTPTIPDNTANRRDSDGDDVAVGTGPDEATLGTELTTGGNGQNNHSYDFGFIAPRYDLALVKTLAPTQPAWILDGDTVNYVVTVRNQGNVPSNGFVVTDVIPYGMSFVSATGSGFSCTLIAGTPPTVADEVRCTYTPPTAADLAPGADVTIELALRADDLAQAPFRNWAEIETDSSSDYSVTDDDSSPGDHNGSDNGSGTGSPGADPSIDHNNIAHNDTTHDEATEDEDDSDPATVNAASTTPVNLAAFVARSDGDELVIRWRTSTEEANLGFNLFARIQGQWRQLNTDLVLSTYDESDATGQIYEHRLVDTGAREFAITDVDINYKEVVHGPFSRSVFYGSELSAVSETQWDTIDETDLSQNLEATSGSQVYVDVTAAGVQRISFKDLKQIGLDWRGVSLDSIALSIDGVPLARHIYGLKSGVSATTMERDTVIEFVSAEKPGDRYNNATRVLLSLNPALVKDIADEPGYEQAETKSAVRTHTIDHDKRFSRIAPDGDPWWMDQILSVGKAATRDYSFDLSGLVAGTTASLRANVWGGNDDLNLKQDHNLVILVNGRKIHRVRFDGITRQRISVEVPSDALVNGENIVTLKVKSEGRRHVDMVRVDSVELSATQKLRGNNDLAFSSNGGTHIVQLNAPRSAVAYRVADTTTRINTSASAKSVRVSGAAGRYFVANDRGINRPRLSSARDDTELFDRPFDYLIVTHHKFKGPDLQRLADARESAGLVVETVDVRDIYHRYSGGATSAAAISEAIRDAHARFGVEYVVLVGDDTYDYRGNLKSGSRSYIPSHYAQAGDHVNQAAADALFGDVDGDSLPDVAVGRLPVRSKRHLTRVIDKTLLYEADQSEYRAVFTADSIDDASRHSFRRDSNQIRRALGESFNTVTAYVDRIGVKAARGSVIDEIERGARLTSYIGHSDRGQWSFENLLSLDDIRSLGNTGTPTVVTQFGCWNNDFVHPGRLSMGEAFLVSTDGGAAAVIGTSTLAGVRTEARFGELLYEEIARPGTSLGKAMNAARRRLALERPLVKIRDILIGTSLLGDPALVPNNRPEF